MFFDWTGEFYVVGFILGVGWSGRGFLFRDTRRVHPCKLSGRVPAANGPGRGNPSQTRYRSLVVGQTELRLRSWLRTMRQCRVGMKEGLAAV